MTFDRHTRWSNHECQITLTQLAAQRNAHIHIVHRAEICKVPGFRSSSQRHIVKDRAVRADKLLHHILAFQHNWKEEFAF